MWERNDWPFMSAWYLAIPIIAFMRLVAPLVIIGGILGSGFLLGRAIWTDVLSSQSQHASWECWTFLLWFGIGLVYLWRKQIRSTPN